MHPAPISCAQPHPVSYFSLPQHSIHVGNEYFHAVPAGSELQRNRASAHCPANPADASMGRITREFVLSSKRHVHSTQLTCTFEMGTHTSHLTCSSSRCRRKANFSLFPSATLTRLMHSAPHSFTLAPSYRPIDTAKVRNWCVCSGYAWQQRDAHERLGAESHRQSQRLHGHSHSVAVPGTTLRHSAIILSVRFHCRMNYFDRSR